MNGYRRVWDNTLKQQVYVHCLGRALVPGEVLHHLNGDQHDLRPENLLALSSQAAHKVVEQIERRRFRGMAPLFEPDELGLGSVDLAPDSSGRS
ncbi:HNH endonuclease [Deinococcus humi]|uniref:HNH nuclease domain-containing protein n=1 Tax=Deinococcus humi TaxID=662880 RepID=A0A7W8K2J2_9DEIO|nr:HNH endonuclease [Deinococcus humi]MBB5366341.1 hypothetical protein [Deinococcus humi]GGO41345.1 hypothetical protein GCM10008949_52080 [Deinococcus humi]